MSGDPDLARLRRDARRHGRWRRVGNSALAAGIGALVLANVAVIGGTATGVSTVERIAGVDVVGIPLLGRGAGDVPGPPADGAADTGEDADDALGAAASSREAVAAGPSLPTWTGTAPPMGEDVADPDASTVPSAPVDVEPTSVPPEATTAPTATPTTTAPAPAQTAVPAPTTPAAPAGPGKRVLDLVNAERASAGCPALAPDSRLAAAASAHAADMVARQFFDHTSPDGSTAATRAAAAGYDAPVAENIATGYASPEVVVAGWMESAGHRANILDCSQRVTGIGHDPGSLPGYAPGTWVQMFG